MTQTKKKLLMPGGGVLILLLLTTMAFVSKSIGNSFKRPKREKVTSAQKAKAPEFKQAIRVFVHKNDIRPREIHAWPGKAQITIENETQADVALQMERLPPNRLQPISSGDLLASAKRKQQEVTLDVGEYVLYEASRPGIRVRLIVEPRR